MLAKFKHYLLVTKPGIVCGNLIAAAGGFLFASQGRPDTALLAVTVTGISMVVAAGCVFNNLADRDLDRLMERTCNRVLARGLMAQKIAVLYGTLLALAGFALLGAKTNALCVAFVLGGLFIYTVAYSLYLKRRSPLGIAIGSLAGAVPPVAGYCAAASRFDLGAFLLLTIFTLWQIPHFHAIAIFRLNDFKTAALPVLPVRRGLAVTKIHILISITAFATATLLPTFFGYAGKTYLAAAATLGITWLFMACAGFKPGIERPWAKRLFVFSILSIIALSAMLALDARGPSPPIIAKNDPSLSAVLSQVPQRDGDHQLYQ